MDDEKQIEKIAAVQGKHNDKLLGYPNVVGTGIGLRQRRGEAIDEFCLVVMVKRKLPPEQLPAGGMLPIELDGVGIDVLETGVFAV